MPIIITPITNKSTLAAFYPSEEKTLRDMLVEASGKADPTDDELEAIFFSWIWDDTKIPSILANYSIDVEVEGFKKLLQSEVTPCFLADYSDYLTAFQDAAEFKRHAYGVTLNNARVWALKYGAMTRRILPWDSATEGYLDTENIRREGSDNRTENETTGKTGTDNKTDTRNITRSGTNTSNASANSTQAATETTSDFPILDTTNHNNIDTTYASGFKKTDTTNTSTATNSATAEATETDKLVGEYKTKEDGTRSLTGNNATTGTENRTLSHEVTTTHGKLPYEQQREYLEAVYNLTDIIVKEYAKLLNANMYAF